MLNIKTLRVLNLLFILLIISEIIFLIVYPTVWPGSIWFTLPFVFLNGLSAVSYKTIIHVIAFLIVNLTPIIISLCNIFEFDYFMAFNGETLISIDKLNSENLKKIKPNLDGGELFKIMREINENTSKHYISQHIPVVIFLGIFQFTFIIFCILLWKTRSWKWIKKSKLNNDKKNVYFVYKLEETLFELINMILRSFIYFFASPAVDGIFTVDITYRELLTIAVPTMLFLVILNINTILCQLYVDKKVVSQIYHGLDDKQILLESSTYFLKKIYKKILKFLGKESKFDINKSRFDEWRFIPESNISLLEIISVKNHETIINDDNDEIVSVENDKSIPKNEQNIEISFNAESDVMIQTNYPLPKTSKMKEYWFYYYEITILSNPNNDETIIAIGFAPKKYSTSRLPGCDTHSVGFHSDEGRIFHNEGYTGSKYAERWGEVNDVIGCGYCPNTGQVFFTMNGKYLGIAYTGLFHTWYPTIGSNGVCNLKVNFGQEEFKYKEADGMGIVAMVSHKADDLF
ncbi:concanavalin A-like lectin/glucanase domain-containing protein [Rhizophagus clarus]|uniref:Concanavalin A-like lectin/glucanase domain-containing protein n=1 Tax=Rhizophagus clarus TaxID=94130 RepID=A0A8H3R335_9GLOM|nr:concanavalin A-like lectin/glucanase domain-containing protein [Rhizophagus clarus]